MSVLEARFNVKEHSCIGALHFSCMNVSTTLNDASGATASGIAGGTVCHVTV